MRTRLPLAISLLVALLGCGPLGAQRSKPPVPDLTAGGRPDDKHDWNLGPTGARGWMWGWNRETTDARQILVTEVVPGTPAARRLRVGDVILGLDDTPFSEDPRRALGHAITRAETKEGRGDLPLLVWRKGRTATVTLKLEVLGSFSDTAPFDCPKTAHVLRRACRHVALNMKGDIDGMMNALLLLGTGRRHFLPEVRDLARRVARGAEKAGLEGKTRGLFSWEWGYRTLFLAEYHLATGDREVLPAIARYAGTIARGQSGVGTWGHGMAWPDLNGGELHGALGGYGALNQSALVCHLGLVLARKCGVADEEIDHAIERANRFFAFYHGKGAIPYGDHRPGWDFHDDNGKNSLAAIVFGLQGRHEEARWFARMTVASYGEREQGHTGNYFSYLWGPLGAFRGGRAAVSAFLREQRWSYELARSHDGSFPYQGGAGMSGGEHKYAGWDCTGAFVLPAVLERGLLHVTGKGLADESRLSDEEVAEAIAAGRGFSCWDKGVGPYREKPLQELLSLTAHWSPAVRQRTASALADRGDAPVPFLVRQLRAPSLTARLGACQALGALGKEAADAVPALTRCLRSDAVWLRIQAALALAHIGPAARSAAPAMLKLAVQEDPEDPRGYTQRYLAFCLFYRGGALGMRGLISRSLEDVDRRLLYPAVRRLLGNEDGRARAALESVYRNLEYAEIRPLLPAIVEAIRERSPSGVMFSSGIRLSGIELLARHRITEGMELCFEAMDTDRWGKQDRILRCLKALRTYGGAARPLLPRLRALLAELEGHREARNMPEQLALCREVIATIEAATGTPELRRLPAR